jgi:hypothetical protein
MQIVNSFKERLDKAEVWLNELKAEKSAALLQIDAIGEAWTRFVEGGCVVSKASLDEITDAVLGNTEKSKCKCDLDGGHTLECVKADQNHKHLWSLPNEKGERICAGCLYIEKRKDERQECGCTPPVGSHFTGCRKRYEGLDH